jgi:hypothetical protein
MNVYEKTQGEGSVIVNQDSLQDCAPFRAPVIDLIPFRERITSASHAPEDVKILHAPSG